MDTCHKTEVINANKEIFGDKICIGFRINSVTQIKSWIKRIINDFQDFIKLKTNQDNNPQRLIYIFFFKTSVKFGIITWCNHMRIMPNIAIQISVLLFNEFRNICFKTLYNSLANSVLRLSSIFSSHGTLNSINYILVGIILFI